MDSPDRQSFLADLRPGGKYRGIIGVYRKNTSIARTGLFDNEALDALFDAGVKWIAQNAAGYDKIDISRCKEKGT